MRVRRPHRLRADLYLATSIGEPSSFSVALSHFSKRAALDRSSDADTAPAACGPFAPRLQ
jgi:hypothetical protein